LPCHTFHYSNTLKIPSAENTDKKNTDPVPDPARLFHPDPGGCGDHCSVLPATAPGETGG
jgi:hypothetical protein